MANESENRIHAAVKVGLFGGAPFAQAFTAAITNVSSLGPGITRVQFAPGVSAAEEVHTMQCDVIELEEGFEDASGSCVRISDTEYEIRTFDNAGNAANAGFSFMMYRVSNSNGQ